MFALRSTINAEFVPQVSWRKIRSILDFIVIVDYAVTSRRLQESFSVGHMVRHSNIFCRTFIKNVRLSDDFESTVK